MGELSYPLVVVSCLFLVGDFNCVRFGVRSAIFFHRDCLCEEAQRPTR